MKPELLAEGYVFLEAPRVDARGHLYFSDIAIGGVFRRTPKGTITHMLSDRKMIGGLAINADGRLVVSGRGGLILYDEKSGERETLLAHVDGKPVSSVNDFQPDGHGGLYAGVADADAQDAMTDNKRPADERAQLVRDMKAQPVILVRADRTASYAAPTGAVITNGIGVSPDGRTVYQAETLEGILAFDRAADGSLSNRRLVIKQTMSDGISVDSEGCVWIAAVKEGAAVRYTPDGKLDRRVELPVKEVASLTFGGEDLRDLYMVTGSSIDQPTYRRTGAVYRVRVDVPGQATPPTRF
jgi:sugar lactone lactonase YvrE